MTRNGEGRPWGGAELYSHHRQTGEEHLTESPRWRRESAHGHFCKNKIQIRGFYVNNRIATIITSILGGYVQILCSRLLTAIHFRGLNINVAPVLGSFTPFWFSATEVSRVTTESRKYGNCLLACIVAMAVASFSMIHAFDSMNSQSKGGQKTHKKLHQWK